MKVKTSKGNFQTKILIGADGPQSTVAHKSGLSLPENVLAGIQTTVKSKFDTDSVELWFGSEIAPDFFAWVVPENENWARVGLATEFNI